MHLACRSSGALPQVIPHANKLAAMSSITTSTKPQRDASKATPIQTLHAGLARVATHVHPFLIFSVYLLQFRSIVAEPVSALTNALFPLVALQVIYAAICLPPTGPSTPPPPLRTGQSLLKPGQRRKAAAAKHETGLSSKIVVGSPPSALCKRSG